MNPVEEVNGQIIGASLLMGAVFYEGRQQGKTLHAETEEELKSLAEQYISSAKAACGNALMFIYPKDAWELRIHY